MNPTKKLAARNECIVIGTHTLQLKNLHRVVLFSHSEDFQVAERRFSRLGVSIDLDTEEISLVLPVELTLNIEVERTESKHYPLRR